MKIYPVNGEPTYRCGAHSSTIDVSTFGRQVRNYVSKFEVLEPRGFTSDHSVLHTVLDLKPCRDSRMRFLFQKVDRARFSETCSQELLKLRDASGQLACPDHHTGHERLRTSTL